MTEIHGTTAPGWEGVSDAFEANFAAGLELGASAFVTYQGHPVVDVWAGSATPGGEPWQADTIVCVYSTTKTMTALAALMLIDRGLLDPDAPVATYWPAFATNGKAAITVAQVMSHTAGLSGFDTMLSPNELYDWQGCVDRLAAQEPWWEPGTQSGYHAITQGYLLGEVIRRIDGRTVGAFLRDEVTGPLTADFHLGFGPEYDARCGELEPPDTGPMATAVINRPDTILSRTFASHPINGHEPSTRAWRAAEIPAANGFGNARSIGRVHAALANGGSIDGVRLLGPDTIKKISEVRVHGKDLVLRAAMAFGLGFGLPNPSIPLPNPDAFFWGGWGGSLSVIDPAAKLTVTYVMNRMGPDLLGDNRGRDVTTAAYLKLLSDLDS